MEGQFIYLKKLQIRARIYFSFGFGFYSIKYIMHELCIHKTTVSFHDALYENFIRIIDQTNLKFRQTISVDTRGTAPPDTRAGFLLLSEAAERRTNRE